MNAESFRLLCILVVTLSWMFFPHEGHAYLDPGTGSYVLQLLIAFVIGALFAIKVFWRKLLGSIKNLFSRTPKP
jgi:hypothetical protein